VSGGPLRLVLRNDTAWNDADLRRFVYAGLRANGVTGTIHVHVTPSPIYSRGCAEVGCVRTGVCRLRLALGRPSYHSTRALWIRRASRLLDHEARHLTGLDHDRMPERLLYSLGPPSSWARGLPMRWTGKRRRPPPPMVVSPTMNLGARRPQRPGRDPERDPERNLGSHESRRRYYVYVVEIGYRAVYVGSSALPPGIRMREHRRGGMTAAHVLRRHGGRLRPELARGYGPEPTREAARGEEQRLARDLERRGYRVYGACRPGRNPSCVL
jgi:hypothetical protein